VVRFAGKEVLTKIITLTPRDASKDTAAERLRLIDEISAASNRQTPVIHADRASNDATYVILQKALFDRYGLLYERKRGEFSDGVDAGYIDRSQILERNLFLRIFLATQGEINRSGRKRIFLKHSLTESELTDPASLELFVDGYELFRHIIPKKFNGYHAKYRDVLAKLYMGVRRTDKALNVNDRLIAIERMWADMHIQLARRSRLGKDRAKSSGEKWKGHELEANIREFVRTGVILPPKEPARHNEATEEFREALDSTFPEGAVAPGE
jgi:hypothetical protein